MSDHILGRASSVRSRGTYIDVRRVLRALALAAWSGFFTWLWIGGEMTRYLGPRTYWVVPFGALLLGAAALLHVGTLRADSPQVPPRTGDVLGLVLLVTPLLAVAIVPDADLGSLAASRKSTGAGVSAAEALSPEAGEPIENPAFREIAYAEESSRYADAIGLSDGTETQLVGFVDDGDEGPEGTFVLTRFYVSCCAADAIPYSVAVDPGDRAVEGLGNDEWVEVDGYLEKRGDGLVLVAEELRPVEEPDDPYLY